MAHEVIVKQSSRTAANARLIWGQRICSQAHSISLGNWPPLTAPQLQSPVCLGYGMETSSLPCRPLHGAAYTMAAGSPQREWSERQRGKPESPPKVEASLLIMYLRSNICSKQITKSSHTFKGWSIKKCADMFLKLPVTLRVYGDFRIYLCCGICNKGFLPRLKSASRNHSLLSGSLHLCLFHGLQRRDHLQSCMCSFTWQIFTK